MRACRPAGCPIAPPGPRPAPAGSVPGCADSLCGTDNRRRCQAGRTVPGDGFVMAPLAGSRRHPNEGEFSCRRRQAARSHATSPAAARKGIRPGRRCAVALRRGLMRAQRSGSERRRRSTTLQRNCGCGSSGAIFRHRSAPKASPARCGILRSRLGCAAPGSAAALWLVMAALAWFRKPARTSDRPKSSSLHPRSCLRHRQCTARVAAPPTTSASRAPLRESNPEVGFARTGRVAEGDALPVHSPNTAPFLSQPQDLPDVRKLPD